MLGDGISVLQSLKSFTVSNQSLKSYIVYGNVWSMDNTLCCTIRGWSIIIGSPACCIGNSTVQFTALHLEYPLTSQVFFRKKCLSLVSLSFAWQILTGYYKCNANAMHHK